MSPELGRWLLTYPVASRISQLAVDGHRLGYVDFPKALGIAIATNLRREVGGDSLPRDLLMDHGQMAEAAVDYRRRCRLRVEEGTILIGGNFTPGAAVSQSRRLATLYVRGELPDTVLTAAPGRELREVVEANLFADRPYVVRAARRHRRGCFFVFHVPHVPLADWIDACAA